MVNQEEGAIMSLRGGEMPKRHHGQLPVFLPLTLTSPRRPDQLPGCPSLPQTQTGQRKVTIWEWGGGGKGRRI